MRSNAHESPSKMLDDNTGMGSGRNAKSVSFGLMPAMTSGRR